MDEKIVSAALDALESLGVAITNFLGKEIEEENVGQVCGKFLSDIITISKKLEKIGIADSEEIAELLAYAKEEEGKRKSLMGEIGGSPSGVQGNAISGLKSLIQQLAERTGMAGSLEEMFDKAPNEIEAPPQAEAPLKRPVRRKAKAPEAPPAAEPHPDDGEDDDILRRIREERMKRQEESDTSEGPVQVEEFGDFDDV